VEVPEGTHQYKYYIDGDWLCHPNEVCCLATDVLISAVHQMQDAAELIYFNVVTILYNMKEQICV